MVGSIISILIIQNVKIQYSTTCNLSQQLVSLVLKNNSKKFDMDVTIKVKNTYLNILNKLTDISNPISNLKYFLLVILLSIYLRFLVNLLK